MGSEAYLKEVQLPSQGKLYSDKIPGGFVSIEPLGTKQEKLFSAGISSSITLINKIFDDCVKCPIPHNDLILGDRLFLLLQIRAVTYGRQYDFSYQCDNCRKKSYSSTDLEKLTTRHPDDKVADASTFKIELPVLGNVLELRLLTGADEESIQRYVSSIQAKSRGSAGDVEYIYRLARRVVTLDGEAVGIREAMTFVETLKGADSLALRDSIEDNDLGPVLEVSPTCEHCGFESEAFALPIDSEFFRPRGRRAKSTDYLAAAERIDASKGSAVGRHRKDA